MHQKLEANFKSINNKVITSQSHFYKAKFIDKLKRYK